MQNSLMKVLEEGCSVDYKNYLFIDPINMRGIPKRKGYQITCNRRGKEFNCLYRENELEAAVDKFILLKNIK